MCPLEMSEDQVCVLFFQTLNDAAQEPGVQTRTRLTQEEDGNLASEYERWTPRYIANVDGGPALEYAR